MNKRARRITKRRGEKTKTLLIERKIKALKRKP